MNRRDYLIMCFMEECAEVAQAMSKVGRFTPHHCAPGHNETNLEGACREYSELMGVIQLLKEEGVELMIDPHVAKEKMDRVNRYFQISVDLGTVTPDGWS